MATTATTRATFGSILGAVTNAATSVSTVFDTATDALNMANSYVKNAAIDQKQRAKAHRNDFNYKLAEEVGMARTERQQTILEYTNKSEQHKQMFEKNYNEVLALLTETE